MVLQLVQQAMQESSLQLPEWFNFVSVIAVIPAGALGGYVAELLSGRGGSVLPRQPSDKRQ